MELTRSLTFYRIIFFTFIGFVFLFMATACQKNNSSQESTPTVSSECISSNNCEPTIYQNNYGYTPYANQYPQGTLVPYGSYGSGQVIYVGSTPIYQYNNSSYFCNCPAGTMPTYNSYGGLGCIQTQLLTYQPQMYLYYSWGYSNNHWVNIPQVSNMNSYNNTNSCYNGVIRSCIVGQLNSCGNGYTCQATTAASAIGVCTGSGYNSGGIITQPYPAGYPTGPIHR